jgi:hypothetical protein
LSLPEQIPPQAPQPGYPAGPPQSGYPAGPPQPGYPAGPQPGYPAGPDYPAAPPPRKTSGLAIAGLILAVFIAPIGFLLSLIAIFKTGAGRARGRGLAVTGIVVSVLVMGILTSVGVWVASSRVFDPGCVAGKEVVLNLPEITDEASAQKVVDDLTAAAAKAEHDDVRVAIQALADDFAQLQKAFKTGEVPPGIEAKAETDGNRIDALCTIGG